MLLMGILAGCSKYDDGPVISLYSKGARVAGKWSFSRVFMDGADSTERFYKQRIDFIFDRQEGGGYFQWYTDVTATSASADNPRIGHWTFIADKDSFKITVYDIVNMDTIPLNWKINRLAYTDFWLERTDEKGRFIEWKLWKLLYAY